jgi:hypothetical protein
MSAKRDDDSFELRSCAELADGRRNFSTHLI